MKGTVAVHKSLQAQARKSMSIMPTTFKNTTAKYKCGATKYLTEIVWLNLSPRRWDNLFLKNLY